MGEQLTWSEYFDDNDNSWFEAVSVFAAGEDHFHYRVKQRLFKNKIEWYSDSDEEAGGDFDGMTWPAAEHAKSYCDGYDGAATAEYGSQQ